MSRHRPSKAKFFFNFLWSIKAIFPSFLWIIAAPDIRKAGRLGNDRPSLGARLGVGLSKPWGVWEGGFDERPGEPPAGLGKLVGWSARLQKALPNLDAKAFQI